MYVDEVLCHGENGGATWDTSHRACIMRKVLSKEVTAGGLCTIVMFSFELPICPFQKFERRWNGTIAFPCDLCLK